MLEINKITFDPGDSFIISTKYESPVSYNEVEIDIAISSSNEPALYFQATNKTYNKNINLQKGTHGLKIKVEDIRINNALAKIAIAIWSKNRSELLFWWRIPIEFKGIDYSTGKNFLNVVYELKD